MVYEWKKGSRLNADVNKVKNELDSIGQAVDAESVVSYASIHRKSELYGCFEWDNKKAGHQYRLVQARAIIRSIVIIPEPKAPEHVASQIVSGAKQDNEQLPVRAYAHTYDGETWKYRPAHVIVSDDDQLRQVFRQIAEGIAALERKAKAFSHLRSTVLDKVGESLKTTRQLLEEELAPKDGQPTQKAPKGDNVQPATI